MSPPAPSACRSCQAEVFWARTDNGKLMPIQRHEMGDLMASVRGGELHVTWHNGDGERPRWVSHFAKCPQADAHRRKVKLPTCGCGKLMKLCRICSAWRCDAPGHAKHLCEHQPIPTP